MNKEWYISIDGKESGPYATSQLLEKIVSKQLRAEDYVWVAGFDEWRAAAAVFPKNFNNGKQSPFAKPQAPNEEKQKRVTEPAPSVDFSTQQPMYQVSHNGVQMGPFDEDTLKSMYSQGMLNGRSQVWRESMSSWAPLNAVLRVAGPNSGDSNYAESSSYTANTRYTFGNAISAFFYRYVKFDSRSSSSEYWNVFVCDWVCSIGLYAFGALLALLFGLSFSIDGADFSALMGGAYILTLIFVFFYDLGTVIPMYALRVRRLHDSGMSGALVIIPLILHLFYIVPIINFLIKPMLIAFDIVIGCMASTPGANQYGDAPLPPEV